MNRTLLAVLIVTFYVGTACAQDATQNQETGSKKHYGKVCAQLTGDSECRVCATGSANGWDCYSRTLKEVPPDASPLPPQLPTTKTADSASGSITQSCWSSKWDQVTDPSITMNLLSDNAHMIELLRQSIQQAGGIEGFVRQAEQLEAQYKSELDSGQYEVYLFGSRVPIDQAILYVGGSIEAAQCVSAASGQSAESKSLRSRPRPLNQYKHPNCDVLIGYRDGPLEHDFDVALIKYNLDKEARLDALHNAKAVRDLMEGSEWWGGSTRTRAEIAMKVKLAADLTNSVLKTLTLARGALEAALDGASTSTVATKMLGDTGQAIVKGYQGEAIQQVEVKTSEKILRLTESTGASIEIVKTAVEQGAKKASEDAGKTIAWTIAEDLNPVVGIQHALSDYKEKSEDLDKTEKEIQDHVGALVNSARSWNLKEESAKAKVISLNQIRQEITDYCTVSITPPD